MRMRIAVTALSACSLSLTGWVLGSAKALAQSSGVVNGVCGSLNGASLSSAPTAGDGRLCRVGKHSVVGGAGPWYWNCIGSGGGATESCSASDPPANGGSPAARLLPADRDASANWRMAGLQSVSGGISAIDARRPICNSTPLAPKPVGTDSSAEINNKFAACASAHPSGSIVQLAAGEFDVAGHISVPSNVTLRGAVDSATGKYCDNASSPYCSTFINRPRSMGGATIGQNTCCDDIIQMAAPSYNAGDLTGHVVNLTADGTQGSSTIQVASIPFGWAAGTLVGIDEYSNMAMQPDPGWIAAGYPGSKVWASPDYRLEMPVHFVPGYTASGYPANCGKGDEGCGTVTSTSQGSPAVVTTPGSWLDLRNQPVVFTTAGSLPSPLVNGQEYYAINASGGTFNVASTPGGKAINTTSAGSGTINIGIDYEYFGMEKYNQRYISEIKQIKSVTRSPCCSLTFDSPLTITYRYASPYSAHVFDFRVPFETYAGIEDMSLSGGPGFGNVVFEQCAYCWAQTVESTVYVSGSFGFNECFRCELNNVEGWKTAYPYIGGGGYDLVFNDGTSETLVQNSVFTYSEKVMVARAVGGGNVIAYNYFDDAFDANSDEGGLGFVEVEDGVNASHWLGSHHFLFEGNATFSLDSDTTWGESPYMTYFRNYASGFRAPYTDYIHNWPVNDIENTAGCTTQYFPGCPKSGVTKEYPFPLRAVELSAHTYWASYIGNVLGTRGFNYANSGGGNPFIEAFAYQYALGGSKATIWALGTDWNNPEIDPEVYYTGAGGPSDPAGGLCVSPSGDYCPVDRTGNYDYLNNAITWDPNNSDHTLPNSFYLTSQPAYFGASGAHCAYSWPWVTPENPSIQLQTPNGSGCAADSGLPAKARYDAGTPFVQP